MSEIELADKMGYNYQGKGYPGNKMWPFTNEPHLLFPKWEEKNKEWDRIGKPHIQKRLNFDYMESYLSNIDSKIIPKPEIDETVELVNLIVNELENNIEENQEHTIESLNELNLDNQDNSLYPISFNKLPRLTHCTCYYPDGIPVSYCNDPLTFNWIRLQIMSLKVPGIYFLTDDDIPKRGEIKMSGEVIMDNPEDIPPFSQINDIDFLIQLQLEQ